MRSYSFGDWWNNPKAPWANAPTYKTCKTCCGVGGIWVDLEDNKITQVEYDGLTQEEKEFYSFVFCEDCDGLGTSHIDPYDIADMQ